LINNLGEKEWAAIHWRLMVPISIPLICLLAIPLSRTQPRKGKFSRLLPSILIYLIYVLVMMYSRKLIESGKIPGALGFWWIHAAMAIFIYWIYRPINKRPVDGAQI
jgi:lipopolysaccharide export system permease protein